MTANSATSATSATSASYANLTNVNGDITVTAAGTATIANSAVTTAKINDSAITSAKIAAGNIVNAAVAAGAAIAYTKLDFGGSNFVSASAVSSPSQGTLRVNGSDIDLGLQTVDSPTFTNLTVSGDLTVNGTTTTLNTTNVLVEDRFMFLASGSAASAEGGIIVETNVNGTGTALFYDGQSTERWALTASGSSQSATSLTPHAYVSAVALDSGSAAWSKNGNIFVDGQGLIYIYS
jgi:type III secretion system FlhB-like substrate exporter